MTSRWLSLTTAWTSFLRARGLPRNDLLGQRQIADIQQVIDARASSASATAARMMSVWVAVGVLAMDSEVSGPPCYAESRGLRMKLR